MKSLISLVIPTRDRAPMLVNCLASLNQFGYFSRRDVEVIVVDNGSATDDTLNLCARFPVNYVREPKFGRGRAINSGVLVCNGEYIAFTDDDVVIQSSDWLDRLRNNFTGRSEIGYVSGDVRAFRQDTWSQRMWEKKGGLSKGSRRKEFDQAFFRKPRLSGFPVRLIAAGANNMIPKAVFQSIGGHDELFGAGSAIGHGESLEICYKIMKYGYVSIYDPSAIVYHQHPADLESLRLKLFRYGIGDTAVHMHFFWEYHDMRSLLESLIARQIQISSRLLMSLIGKYPLSKDLLLAQMAGNAIGPFAYVYARLLMKMQHRNTRSAPESISER
jgi:GT2 family glycosyltransferase